YSLLGASGCGKTTLLSIIIGMRRLDKGEVKVFGIEPGKSGANTIGYMPQDIALYEIFRIREILSYFGQIYGMAKSEIRSRTKFLCNFLSLPDTSKFIKDLSGGQKRRVSFACALIHEPEFLILDEPCVGLDPILRERMWNHLCEIVAQKNKTVLITTHYVEETRNSNKVGLLCNGRLLLEDHPHVLMKTHNSDLLEDVILKLYKHDAFGSDNTNAEEELNNSRQVFVDGQKSGECVVGIKYMRKKSEFLSLCGTSQVHVESIPKTYTKFAFNECAKISALLKRNFLLHFRQPAFVVVQLFIPALQILIFNLIMGSEPYGIKIGVVNNDIPMGIDNQTFLDHCSHQNARPNSSCFGGDLSCSYFKMFEKDQVDWRPVRSESEALENVHRGETMGFLTIPKNFNKQMQNKLLHKQFASNESLLGSTIHIRLDFSNKLSSSYLIKEFHERFLLFIQDVVAGCGEDPRLVTLPLKVNAVYGSVQGGWPEFFQPAFILWIIFLIPTAFGILYVADVKAGTLDRTLTAGVKYYHLLISILISEGVMTLVQLGLCFIVLLFGFNFQVVGSLSLTIFLCFLMGMIGVTLGLFIGTICNHEMEVIMAVASIYMITIPASGGVWPLSCISRWYRVVSYLVPVTVPLEAIRSVVNRGWGLTDPIVWEGLLVMLGWIFICCLLSAIFHKLRH
ncbi:ABC transporter G family member 23, partial [Folsomia candida]